MSDLFSQFANTPLGAMLQRLTGGQAGPEGLQALIERLRAGGLGRQVESWISTDPNEPVAPEELGRALGEQETEQAARQGGMERGALLGLLAAFLPRLVDMLTPQGRLPQPGEAPAAPQGGLAGLLGGLLGGGGAGGLAGGLGALLGQGGGAAGGLGALLGGAGGEAARQPGLGGSLSDSPGRIGPAPAPEGEAPASDPARRG
ncbi:YidB family protein [Crenalkalicoccus roseus]|uniref:YidB family protein n=1 Tax=Crenalkalicoccus roseus TaxID=1485588 RepID=UPI0010812039|nr:YidB family protein [Crenalkalicoccus roseus]